MHRGYGQQHGADHTQCRISHSPSYLGCQHFQCRWLKAGSIPVSTQGNRGGAMALLFLLSWGTEDTNFGILDPKFVTCCSQHCPSCMTSGRLTLSQFPICKMG